LGGDRLHSSDSGQSPMVGCCEESNETFVTHMAGNFIL